MSPEIEYVPYSAKELMLKFRSENPRYFTDAPDTPKFPNKLLRIHRAIRWFERAEKESDDPDAAFIFCWIAFNAAYARDMPGKPLPEAKEFQSFIRKINRIDTENVIADYVMREISQTIVSLVSNQYVFRDFWSYHNGDSGSANWKPKLAKSEMLVKGWLERGETVRVLATLFDRLYVLRNQLVHGGATWNSSVSKEQVKDGAEIMGFLVPVFIDLMIDNSGRFDSPAYYPFVGPRRTTS